MKEHFVKYFIFSFCLLFSVHLAQGQEIPKKVQKGQEAWRLLKKAQDALDEADYGNAIRYAEESREIRKQDAKWQIYILEGTLKKARIRRTGDDLDRVLPVLEEMQLNDAVSIVKGHMEKLGEGYFDNSYSKVFDYLHIYNQYPEADYLLGKVYRLEGEFEVALSYMKNAYEYNINLDVPMERYDLLYDIASLSYDLGKYEDYEKHLLLVVKDNEYFSDTNFMRALSRIVEKDSGEAVDKFFLLYRCPTELALKALVELTGFYRERGELEKTIKCSSLASVIAVTKLENVLKQRINDFEYKNLGQLLSACSRYDDIVAWGNNENIWKLFCVFAESTAANGKILFARELLKVLSQNEPEEYWKKYAQEVLFTKTVEETE